ncbi:hypothetical protein DEJ33_07240 [Curtobacterium sp. MCPF17_047]|uniref:Ig-like domain-containing protein n=1 Tax=Curtobacterium sp. MCPF17_047 TaxID=2175654 RepID=UPI000DA71DF9|nr:Ig-like domain-containing protein [Curtobacterium sp. MCPF17_047]PZF67041.1 hypothetical protein DEJ33_07240 [Curtobacterium sp. MCPF17_047]
MRKINRATAGAAFGIVLAAGFVPAVASAATASSDAPAIPGATAERPITDSRTSIAKIQGVAAQDERNGNRLFVTSQATPEAQVTSTVANGTLKIVDASGNVLCIGSAAADRPNLYSCELEPLVSGPQTITAAVVKANGTYSTPTQAELDAYAATPTIESVTRDGDDLVVAGHTNREARVESSIDRTSVLTETDTDTDGSFRIRIPGGATAEQAFVRTVNDAIPADTHDHDEFATSNWALASTDSEAGSGEETPAPGDGSGEAQAPVYDVTSPAAGATVRTAQPTFTGHGRPDGRVAVQTASGETLGVATADTDGSWEVTLEGTLQLGGNDIAVSFENPDGSWTKRVTQEVTRVARTDAFRITTPADGSTVTDPRPTIEGATVGSYRRISVQDENGTTYASGSSDAEGDFRLTFDEDLRAGVNTLSVQYQEQGGNWASSPYTLHYDTDAGEEPGSGEGEQPGDGDEAPAPAEVQVSTTRLDDADVVLGLSGAEGTEVTVVANGVTERATIGDQGLASVVVPAPAATTTTAHVTSTNGDRSAEQDVVIGDGAHPSDQVTAAVVSSSALTGSAEIDAWGPASGIGGLQAEDADGNLLAYGTIGADGSGHLTVTGLTAGEHVLTIVSGGLSTQVTVTI